MAKSMRSKWKRKMRAIKRVGMDEKVLQRMKKMLADHEKEEKEEAQWKAQQQQAQNKDAIVIDVTPNEPPKPAGDSDEDSQSSVKMESEAPVAALGSEPPKKGVSLRKMRDADNRFPSWMSTKKIKRHTRILKKKNKRGMKEARNSRHWKLAIS